MTAKAMAVFQESCGGVEFGTFRPFKRNGLSPDQVQAALMRERSDLMKKAYEAAKDWAPLDWWVELVPLTDVEREAVKAKLWHNHWSTANGEIKG